MLESTWSMSPNTFRVVSDDHASRRHHKWPRAPAGIRIITRNVYFGYFSGETWKAGCHNESISREAFYERLSIELRYFGF